MRGSGCEKLKQGDQFGGAEAPARDNGGLAYTTVIEVERSQSTGPGYIRVTRRIGADGLNPWERV